MSFNKSAVKRAFERLRLLQHSERPGWTIMQTVSLEQAVAMIPDGASLMIGGFMAVGTPESH